MLDRRSALAQPVQRVCEAIAGPAESDTEVLGLADGTVRTKTYYCAEIRWTQPDGTPERGSAQRSSKAAAREWLTRKRVEIASGKAAHSDERRITVGELLDQWLAAKSPFVRPSTITVYKAARKHLEPLDARRVVVLTCEEVHRCMDREGVSPRMRMVSRASLRPHMRLIREDLFPPGSAPRVHRKRMQIWTPAQAGTFSRHTKQTRLGLL